MKKILFIDYFFPPLAADWRGTAFVKLLPEFGWQPIVISANESVRYDKDYNLLGEIPENTEIHRVGHHEPSRVWQFVRNKLRIGIDFPDYYKTWYRPAYQTASKILQKEKVDLIYSASPTFVTAFVAMEVKRKFDIPWVADFLDGWAVNDFLNLQYDQTLIKPLRWFQKLRIRNAERHILETADKAVVIHQHVKQRWCELYQIKESKIEVVTDGYDESVFKRLTPHVLYPDKLTITFLGSYYSSFEQDIVKFLKNVYEVEKEVQVVFIGRIATAIQEMNVPNVTCVHHLPREKALSFALGSDFLFVVMPLYARWTPTKTYDYLRLGKPILALVPDDGDAARIVREAKAGFVLSFEEKEMKRQMEFIFDKWRKGEFKTFQPDQEYIAQFERKNVTRRIVEVFNEVLH